MSTEEQRVQLDAAIASLEAQRGILGDAVVELALAGLRQQLEALCPAASGPPRAPLEGERKLVTIMFADISGFTALSERLDPEQVRSLMNACFEHLVPVIQKYDGTVDKFLGDAVVALFGAPLAHENDPERALRAALEMREALQGFNRRHGTDLDLHFGINTGTVVAGGIGSQGRQEYSVMGDPVNVAARLEDASERGEILVGADTFRLTAPLFEFELLTPIAVKGKVEPVSPYRLRGPKRTPGSLRGIRGLRSPLVGRTAELRRLKAAFRALGKGRGGKIGVIGEAGQGKSRLVAEARQALPSRVGWVEGRALSYTENISYWQARDVLYSLLGVTADTPLETVAAALRVQVEKGFADQVEEVYPYLARLLELPLDEATAERIRYLSAEALQQRILSAFREAVRARARAEPLVLAWEDLHWADPSSLQLLETLLPLTDQVPLLLLFVFRPEQGRAWSFHQRLVAAEEKRYPVLELGPLTREQSTELLHNLLKIENLPEATRHRILERAEGNAFFLEEVLRSLIDAGLVVIEGDRAVATQAIAELQVPDTLQGVIMARIDRLSPEDKRTLQTASVIGRVFQQRVLAYLLGPETESERLQLIRLRAQTSVPDDGTPLDLEYIFKHVITQDVTYNSLLIARRKELHRITGEAIEALFAEHLEELSATLGYHFERAEVPEKAISYLSRAADRARETYANAEAIALYRAAIAQIGALPGQEAPGAERWTEVAARLHEGLGDVLELTGQREEARAAYQEALALVPAEDPLGRSRLHRRTGITWAYQHHYDEALQAYDRAEATLGNAPGEEAVEWWREWTRVQIDRLSTYYFTNRVDEAAALIETVRPVVDRSGTPKQRARFFNRLAGVAMRRDGYRISDETLAYAEASLAASEESGNLGEIALGRFTMGFTWLWRGDLNRAEELLQAALPVAERIGDHWIQTVCQTYLALVHRKRGEVEAARPYLSRALALATAGELPQYIAMAKANLAWIAWREGSLCDVSTNARAALEVFRRLSAPWMIEWTALWPLTGAALAQGQTDDAIEAARILLAPGQQRMPDELAARLESALHAWDGGQAATARVQLQGAVELAQEQGYL